jgi:hypothetical protein
MYETRHSFPTRTGTLALIADRVFQFAQKGASIDCDATPPRNFTPASGIAGFRIIPWLFLCRVEPSWNAGGGDRSPRQMGYDSASGDREPFTQLLSGEVFCFCFGLKGAG